MDAILAALVQLGIVDRATAERMARSADPEAARLWAEETLTAALSGALQGQQARLLELLRQAQGRPTAAALDAFWTAEDARLSAAVSPTLAQIASERAIVAGIASGGDMWLTVHQHVIDWVQDYYTNADAVGSFGQLNLTARTQFANAFTDWQRGELDAAGFADGLPQLIRALEPTFGAARAEIISITEVTRVYFQAEKAAAEANPLVSGLRWMVAGDELVCPVCAPLNGQFAPKGQRFPGGIEGPPAHPRCRCWGTPETAYTEAEPSFQEGQRRV